MAKLLKQTLSLLGLAVLDAVYATKYLHHKTQVLMHC